MSLRPTVSSFELAKLEKLFGCGDQAVAEAVNRRIRDAHRDDLALRVRARDYVQAIVHRGRSARYADEDEVFQLVINELAHFGQEHRTSGSLFWEFFFGELEAKRVRPADGYLSRSLDHLMSGSSIFGPQNVSGWAYYAYLRNEAASLLRDHIAADARLRAGFDADAAIAWLDETVTSGRDVWCWVS